MKLSGSSVSDDQLEALLLLVTEVITNAVVHGSPEPDGQIGLRLERDARTIRVVATDGGHHFKSSLDKGDEEREHFRLFLVDTLSDRWGVSVDGQKGVWFEIDF